LVMVARHRDALPPPRAGRDWRYTRSRLIRVRVVVTQIAWDGRLRRQMLDTAGLPDAGQWESLVEEILAVPPPYRAAPGRPVYVIHAGDRAIVVGEDNLTGSLRDLVTAILEGGAPA